MVQVYKPKPETNSCAEPTDTTASKSAIVDWSAFDAALFDLDGVITQSAQLHAQAWQETFDPFLKERARQLREGLVPFNVITDYAQYVDGKPRLDGIRSFLQSRGIDIPEGEIDDSMVAMTINGLAKRKNAVFLKLLHGQGVSIYPDAAALLQALRGIECHTAIITASRNCKAVLEVTGLTDRFDVQIDGNVARELNLSGKPAPDTFIEAARRLAVEPGRAIVIEDSIAGVTAGRAGDFGLVVGVDRADRKAQLLAAGADHVVADLMELGAGIGHG